MLRRDLIAAISEVLTALKSSGVVEMFTSARSEKGRPEPTNVLSVLRAYSIAAHSFSEPAREIVRIFQIEPLEDAEAWMTMITGDSSAHARLGRTISMMQNQLPKLIELLHQDTVSQPDAAKLGASSAPESIDVVRISLVEESGQFSTVQRVIEALSACKELYDALQRLNGDTPTPLAIGAIDSGSDKSFDLFGAAALMKEFRELVVSIWGLIVFHREHKLGKRLELIASALPVLERVAALEHANKLGREEAQIIRNGIVEGAKKFIASGVVTDDLAAHATHDPRALLTPEPKLLSGPALVDRPSGDSPHRGGNDDRAGGARSSEPGAPSTRELSEQDLERLADKLAQRSLRGRRDTSDDEGDSKPDDNGG